jgi:hypothetical protein
VVRGKVVETEELPAYCAVALAGLNDLPDTIMTRSIVIRMRRRGPNENVEPWRLRVNGAQAEPIYSQLARWSSQLTEPVPWPAMPDGIEDRNADVWEALLAVADLAGGDWPELARVAAVTLVTDSLAGQPSLGVLLLRDLRAVFNGHDRLTTEHILTALHQVDESPWADLRGKAVDARWLSGQLGKYGVKPKLIRFEDGPARGYEAADLADPWSRYVKDDVPLLTEPFWKLRDSLVQQSGTVTDDTLPLPAKDSVTSVTAATACEPTKWATCENRNCLAFRRCVR